MKRRIGLVWRLLKGKEEELWDKKDGMKVMFVYDEEKERKIDVKPECGGGRQRANVEDRKIEMSEGNRGRGNRIRKKTELMKKE